MNNDFTREMQASSISFEGEIAGLKTDKEQLKEQLIEKNADIQQLQKDLIQALMSKVPVVAAAPLPPSIDQEQLEKKAREQVDKIEELLVTIAQHEAKLIKQEEVNTYNEQQIRQEFTLKLEEAKVHANKLNDEVQKYLKSNESLFEQNEKLNTELDELRTE